MNLLTPRQRRISRQFYPEFQPKPAGAKVKTRTLRQMTAPPPPVPLFTLFRRPVIARRQLMSENHARKLLRKRRRTERQNRRRGRQRSR